LESYFCGVRREALGDRKPVSVHNAGSQQRQPRRDVPHLTDLLHVPAVGRRRRRNRGRRCRTAAAADRQRGAGDDGRCPPIVDAAQLRDIHAGTRAKPRTADRVADARL